MDSLVSLAINISGWAVVIAIIYERVNKLEDKIVKCVLPKIEDIDKRVTVIESMHKAKK